VGRGRHAPIQSIKREAGICKDRRTYERGIADGGGRNLDDVERDRAFQSNLKLQRGKAIEKGGSPAPAGSGRGVKAGEQERVG